MVLKTTWLGTQYLERDKAVILIEQIIQDEDTLEGNLSTGEIDFYTIRSQSDEKSKKV